MPAAAITLTLSTPIRGEERFGFAAATDALVLIGLTTVITDLRLIGLLIAIISLLITG
jgi:hypothetical protein